MLKKIFLILALILATTAVNVEAAESNLPFDMLATTYVEGGPNEMVALVKMKSDGSNFFFVTAEGLEISALIPYVPEVYNFHLRRDEYDDPPPLIFMMFLMNESRGQLGENLGEWNDNLHVVPVYALFHINKDGKIVCDKPFFSADDMESTHFHSQVQNPNHERLIEIFMTNMPRLHEVVKEKNIALP